MRKIRFRRAHASSLLRSASCRMLLYRSFVFGRMTNSAGRKPSLPSRTEPPR
jgi:hypothetical protein